jgi:hypothetical protein
MKFRVAVCKGEATRAYGQRLLALGTVTPKVMCVGKAGGGI